MGTNKIILNDLLRFENLKNIKIRLLLYAGRSETGGRNNDFIEFFQEKDKEALMGGLFWNYKVKRSYHEGDIVVGLAKIEKNHWLLFNVSKVTKDLNVLNGVGYEYETLEKDYDKYLGRVVVRYHNKSQNLIRRAESIMQDLVVEKVLPDVFDDDIFPGYENVCLSWNELNRNINKESWKTALQNQKGIYLITDKKNGKQYVGSAYGETMLLGRWQNYIKNGHGGNMDFKKLGFEYIKNNFQYSILDIYKSKVDDAVIINREAWWKNTLLSREFGYNNN